MSETLELYNTIERKIVPFIPLSNQLVKIYACGPTVYNYAHIGNLRTYINQDLLVRALKFNGFKIKHVINITDVGHLTSDEDSGDDKMELSAAKEGATIWEVAQKYTDAFMNDFQELNITKPTLWSKATDHIDEQIELVKRLEEAGLAYKIENDGIYYDTFKFKDYNRLGGQNLEELKAGARINFTEGKKNISDFALWKVSPQNKKRLMQWPSPWGMGFPGWHIECSAMALKHLGEEIDIHCGGVDHIKIHHSNEIAQVEPLTKKRWVRYWMHSEFLIDQSGKMSKSTGEFLTLSLLKSKGYLPLAYRFYCLGSHYRSKLNFSYESLDAAQQGYIGLIAKLRRLMAESKDLQVENEKLIAIRGKIKKIINNDLNSSETLAYLFTLLKDYSVNASTKIASLDVFDALLGLDLVESLKKIEKIEKVPEEVRQLVLERSKAKSEKNFVRADSIRLKIKELGYLIEDRKEGIKIKKG
ncbi:MAG: cysteine--tRNA ligase [Bdellovibrionales bacterium RIFOXYB1_FULL_37_110]|nr:MAG: cysteine--tRNA ligase [Bdellovibrionales bacterium RIFOXYC1_FULL_37_79]OFZ59071.1 MAG: cysteine--tRNA ligase [Bdellovibrionales bacterium RIFOXYB1_FULL_37_110]OFZ64078.1 MAG: cysteine--tRNA ligase [Bdellovibrionales bacterium RIFOXYD1_FULL_36_51]